jgi:ribonucleoside-diphosphate reductase protein NrdI
MTRNITRKFNTLEGENLCMIVLYDSMTGLTKNAAKKLGYDTMSVKDYQEDDDPVVFLMTRSFGFGEVPKDTKAFLSLYAHRVFGVAVSGNKNWGANFGKAGVTIEKEFGIPLVTKFEGLGFPSEIERIKSFIQQHLSTIA